MNVEENALQETTHSVRRNRRNGEAFGFLGPAQKAGELGRLGDYRILGLLAEGGMGIVFQAEDLHLKRPVALKVMKPEVATEPEARERFFREAQAAALEHEHIVSIYQIGEDRGVPFIAMKLLKGASLEHYLANGASLPVDQVLRLGRQIARGLAAAHTAGLIHRDIKPSNLWLEPELGGRIKILDFGLARAVVDDANLTKSGTVLGTPAYLAPEQARCEKVDTRCDLFSLGVVLYRMCSGQLPFTGDNSMAVLIAVATETPKSLTELVPNIPEPLAQLVMQLLSKDAARRPATAAEVAQRLEGIEQELYGATGATSPLLPKMTPLQTPVLPPEPTVISAPSSKRSLVPTTDQPVAPSPAMAAAAPPAHEAPAATSTTPPKRRITRPWLVAATAFSLAWPVVYYQGGTALCFVRNRGQVSLTVPDASMEWSVRENGNMLQQARGQRVFSVPCGGHDLEIAVRVPDGSTRTFTRGVNLSRGATVVVDLARELEELEADPQRRAALWVLECGGRLSIRVKERTEPVREKRALPWEPFQVTSVSFFGVKNVRDPWLARLAAFPNLGSLSLNGTHISDAGMTHLAGLTALSELDLGNTKISDAGLTSLEGLTNLRTLLLNNTRVKELSPVRLEKLTRLVHLDLSRTLVKDAALRRVGQLRGLVRLELSHTSVSDMDLSYLQGLTNLTVLKLRETLIGDPGLANLTGLRSLEQLELTKTQISDSGLAHLDKLRHLSQLDLGNTRVSDRGIALLRNLSSVHSFGLTGTRLSAGGIQNLRTTFPSATVSWSEPNRSTAEAVIALGGRVTVEVAGPMEIKDINAVGDLPREYFKLKHVNLSGVTRPMGELWPRLASLNESDFDNFRGLDLSNSLIGDNEMEGLLSLTTLTELSLANTPVTDKGIFKFHNRGEWKRLNLQGTRITATGLLDLRQALPGCLIETNLPGDK